MADKSNELYEKAIRDKSDVTLNYVGKFIEEEQSGKMDDIIKESQDVHLPDGLHEALSNLVQEEIKKEKKSKRSKLMRKVARIAACFAVFVILTGTVLITNVEAFREKIYNIFFNEQDKYVQLKPMEIPFDIDKKIPSDWNDFWYPSYLPEGYTLESAEELFGEIIFSFHDQSGYGIGFCQDDIENMDMNLDNSVMDPQIIKSSVGDIYWIKSQEITTFVWTRSDKYFTLDSLLPLDTMVEIAENIYYLKK